LFADSVLRALHGPVHGSTCGSGGLGAGSPYASERGRRGASGELALLKPRQKKRHACGMLVVGGTFVKMQDSVGNVQLKLLSRLSQP